MVCGWIGRVEGEGSPVLNLGCGPVPISLGFHVRRHSVLATFNGIAYRDYWTWNDVKELSGDTSSDEAPVRMVSAEDEAEIEHMCRS